MRSLFLIFNLFCLYSYSIAQSSVNIISELKEINSQIVNIPCDSDKGMIISNRAMNLFLANHIGSYLSEIDDLSFYKNNVIVNSSRGTLAINHNFFQPKGIDEQVRSFLVIGARANFADAYNAAFTQKQFNNELGFTVKQSWIGKTKTSISSCKQKEAMDSQRAAIIYQLENEIKIKDTVFESNLNKIQQSDVPGQEISSVKTGLKEIFYADLKEEYSRNFADLQAQSLLKIKNYRLITSSWTSILTYIPLFRQKYSVAESFTDNFESKYSYPWEFSINHTRFWQSGKWGRLFLTISARIIYSNSKQSYLLDKTTLSEYKNLGGTDTLYLANLSSNEAYIGEYETFFTPEAKMKIVFFPGESHLGLSCMIEQSFGTYNALDVIAGIPIELIDKKGDPAANFEFRVHYFDLSNTIKPEINWNDKVSVELNVGVPFSRIIY